MEFYALKSRKQCFGSDARFEAGELCTGAKMRPMSEADVLAHVGSRGVEQRGLLEHRRIRAGDGPQRYNRCAEADLHTLQLCIVRGAPVGALYRRIIAQRLLNEVRDQRRLRARRGLSALLISLR